MIKFKNVLSLLKSQFNARLSEKFGASPSPSAVPIFMTKDHILRHEPAH
jgi:hypothetical protein